MWLNIVIFGLLFLSFGLYWYWENPSTVYSLNSNSKLVDLTSAEGNWVNNQTWFSLFSIRPYNSFDSMFINRNVGRDCPDIDKEYPNRKQSWSSRRVYIYAAIGFIIIKGVGLALYVYSFLKVFACCFNMKIHWLKVKWEIMNSLAFIVLITSLVFWLVCTGVIITIEGIQAAPIVDILLIFVFRILSIHAKKYMNDIERYRIMQDFN